MDKTQKTKLVYGVDANALYLWCLMREMPTGSPRRWRREKAESLYWASTDWGSKTARGWLEWESRVRGCSIRHRDNGGEVRVGEQGLPVDGFCADSSTVFQFHGCYWHGHPCPTNTKASNKREKRQRYEDTQEKRRLCQISGLQACSDVGV